MVEVYFTRESLCMADDVNAPNIAKVILPGAFGEEEFKQAIQRYHSWDFTRTWCGYVNGSLICEVMASRNEQDPPETVITARFADGWSQLVTEYKEVYFKRADSDASITYYGLMECEKIFRNPVTDLYGQGKNHVIEKKKLQKT